VDYKEELQDRLSKCTTVIDDLNNTGAWKILIEDMEKQKKIADDNWHLIQDPLKLETLRIGKLGVNHVISIPEAYKQEKEQIEEELERLDNPETVIQKDYDGE